MLPPQTIAHRSRNTSLLADAVDAMERRAAEAPELMRRNSRQELGNFWAETVRNSSSGYLDVLFLSLLKIYLIMNFFNGRPYDAATYYSHS